MRVCLTRRWPDAVEAWLAERFEVTRNPDDVPFSAAKMRDAMASHDVLCPTVSDRIDASLFDGGCRVRLIANYGVGVDHIDLDTCRAAGIMVSNTPGVLTEATAELALTLMLMAARRAGEGERELRAGRWSGWRPTHLLGSGLSGRTLGLVGFGRIGQRTAEMAAAAFGMTILYHARRPVDVPGARHVADLDALLAEADIVSLHCPGGPETRNLINADRLARMKPGAILINTARGSVVDEAALAEALRSGRIAAAGLDVYRDEPAVHPALLALENVVLLPHLGSATIETRTAMGMCAARNVERWAATGSPIDRIA